MLHTILYLNKPSLQARQDHLCQSLFPPEIITIIKVHFFNYFNQYLNAHIHLWLGLIFSLLDIINPISVVIEPLKIHMHMPLQYFR